MLEIQFPLEKQFDTGKKIIFDIPIHNINNKKQDTMNFLPNYMYFFHGTNGVGKSTLLNVISFLTDFIGNYHLYDGKIKIGKINNGVPQKFSKGQIRQNYFSFIFQDPHIINIYTIEENLKILNGNFCFNRDIDNIKEDILKLENLLIDDRVYIIDKLSKIQREKDNSPYYLSGGEKQLLSFIRALIKPSNIIFADEPWAAMDLKLKEFVESQLYAYLENKDIFYKYRKYKKVDKINIDKNLVVVISHEFHHKYNSKNYGIFDEYWSYKIPVNKNINNDQLHITLNRFKKNTLG